MRSHLSLLALQIRIRRELRRQRHVAQRRPIEEINDDFLFQDPDESFEPAPPNREAVRKLVRRR